MKISRRGLGGLFAGAAVSAKQIDKKVNEAFYGAKLPYMPGTLADSPTPIIDVPPHERLQALLYERDTPPVWLFHDFKPGPYTDPVNVTALKSISAAGREYIAYEYKARRAIERHRESVMARIDELLRDHPALRILLT